VPEHNISIPENNAERRESRNSKHTICSGEKKGKSGFNLHKNQNVKKTITDGKTEERQKGGLLRMSGIFAPVTKDIRREKEGGRPATAPFMK